VGKLIKKQFFAKKAHLVAPKMLGLKICTPDCEAALVEVEAYEGKNDPASHAYTKTPRSVLMHETYAHWYVYFVYGNHYCVNITCGKNEAGAILLREAIPLKGIELMKRRRKTKDEKNLCNGPGKLCAALGIDKKFNGLKLGEKLWLEEISLTEKKVLQHNPLISSQQKNVIKHNKIVALPRVGISKAKKLKWRFRLV
jgi:DNA-3-methyladenine glycosylase